LLVIVLAAVSRARSEPTVEELKARVSSANVADKAKLCLEIAEKQLNEADKEYTADNVEKGQTSLTDVVSYSELARDYSIQSHKHQKQTEIAIRAMTRKLNDLLHVLGREDQVPVKEAISHLERVRDDLLAAMFPKGAK
jgi:predicted DNA-binding protein